MHHGDQQLRLELVQHGGFATLYPVRPGARLVQIDRQRPPSVAELPGLCSVCGARIGREFRITENGDRTVETLSLRNTASLLICSASASRFVTVLRSGDNSTIDVTFSASRFSTCSTL